MTRVRCKRIAGDWCEPDCPCLNQATDARPPMENARGPLDASEWVGCNETPVSKPHATGTRAVDESLHGFSAVDIFGNRIDPATIDPYDPVYLVREDGQQ